MSTKKGREGERIAGLYLVKKGYRIVETNFFSRLGEIDIIAYDPHNVLVFCEVKTYKSKSFVSPFDAVTATKLKRIRKTAEYYLLNQPTYKGAMRLDLLVVHGDLVQEHLLNIV
ncbi:MAG: hypothetical protein EXS67_00950 [Candidatus Margulisbacteria bacterium]|nr:hypothetical protein [Candidatus Margulisiibacteriota bacterium]